MLPDPPAVSPGPRGRRTGSITYLVPFTLAMLVGLLLLLQHNHFLTGNKVYHAYWWVFWLLMVMTPIAVLIAGPFLSASWRSSVPSEVGRTLMWTVLAWVLAIGACVVGAFAGGGDRVLVLVSPLVSLITASVGSVVLGKALAHCKPVGSPGTTVRCLKCGYDLRAQQECRCPECGKEYSLGELWLSQRP